MGSWTQVGNIRGPEGKSAYQLWLEAGNTGTVQDFLASLHGADGEDGEDGQDGGGDGGLQPPTHRIQRLDLFHAVGGTFTLSFGGQTTEPLTRTDDSSMPGVVAYSLQSLSSMNGYGFSVTQQYAGTTFTFSTWPEGTTEIPDITIQTDGLIDDGQPVEAAWTRSDPPDPTPATTADLEALSTQLYNVLSGLAQQIPHGAVIDTFGLLDIPTVIVPVTTETQPGGILDNYWAVGGSFTCTYPGVVSFQAVEAGSAFYLLHGVQDVGNLDPAIFTDSIAGGWTGTPTPITLEAGQSYTWFAIAQNPEIETIDISQISYVASQGGVNPVLLAPDTAVNLRVTEQGTLHVEKAPASTREDSGARMYGPYDIAPYSRGPALQEGFSPTVGALLDESTTSHALSLHAVSGIMEARVALTLDVAALTSGVGGPTGPFESRVAMNVLDTGFDYGVRSVFPLTISEPAPGFSAQIEFTPTQGETYPPYVSVVINKQSDASWDDLGTGLTASGTFIAPLYKLDELKGQRGYAPGFEGGAPSAPKPSATRLFAAKQIQAVAAQPNTGQYINIGPIVDDACLPVGFGDINNNTGPIKIVAWRLGAQYPVDYGFTFETEEIRTWRRLNDGWVWVPSSDPRGGTDGSTDYLATNAPVPGPGPVLTPWRAVTGTDPVGLGHMIHVLDVAQHSNGNLYIVGARDFTAQEAIDADAAAGGPYGFVGADNSMACVWRSDDGGVTWTEVVKTFYPYGPNGYQRLYAIGQIDDRLFVQSFEPCLADGTPDVDGHHRGYWQMEPDESWTLMPPLDVDPGIGLGLGFFQDRAVPRASNRSSWGGSYVNDEGYHAIVYTYTDHLVLTQIPGNTPIGVDEKDGGTPVGNGYITLGVLDDNTTALRYGDGTPMPVDRIRNSEPFDRWSFQAWGNKLLVCNRQAVYSIDRTYPEEPAPPTEES